MGSTSIPINIAPITRIRYTSPPTEPLRVNRPQVSDIDSPPRIINRGFSASHAPSYTVTPSRRQRPHSAHVNQHPRKHKKTSQNVPQTLPPTGPLPISYQEDLEYPTVPPFLPATSPPITDPGDNPDPSHYEFSAADSHNLNELGTYTSNQGLFGSESQISSTFPTTLGVEPFQAFVEAVESEVCNLYQLASDLYVVRGWNTQTHTITPSWYHLQVTEHQGAPTPVCMCLLAGMSEECFHQRFLVEFEPNRPFQSSQTMTTDQKPFILARSLVSETSQIYHTLFSIPTLPNSHLRNRAIVQYQGEDSGHGTWQCNKHPLAVNCPHVTLAINMLKQLGIFNCEDSEQLPEIAPNMGAQYCPTVRPPSKESVSYLPIPPPMWCRISSDPPPPVITPLKSPPQVISYQPENASCGCLGRPRHSPQGKMDTLTCKIYGLANAWTCKIEVQKCQKCPRYLGPDCREMGLFNWNNTKLFSHALLDDYTSFYTSSETPFTAWISVVSRRYTTDPENPPFVTENEFRTVWFSYIQLIPFEHPASCLKCGPTPNTVIFDGVSISMNNKYVASTLRPPTTIHPDSPVRTKTHRQYKLQCIPDTSLRRNIKQIIQGPSLCPVGALLASSVSAIPHHSASPQEDDDVESGFSEDEGTSQRNQARRERRKLQNNQALLDRYDLIPAVLDKLRTAEDQLYSGLANLFDLFFGTQAVLNQVAVPDVYRALFLQICAEETSLQMMNNLALRSLEQYLFAKTKQSALALKLIPSLYHVLDYEFSTRGGVRAETFDVAAWLYKRGELVRRLLCVDEPQSPPRPIEEISWKKTGCYYSMPQIRHRPQYPHLHEDKALRDIGSEYDGGCKKYYSKYSPKKLSGGIMVAWCPHSVSYGFHCIPVAEGRNDVFSALYTRWSDPPDHVCYDFGCALAPYCYLREPGFFQNTLFVIDDFHAPDHTKCGAASFLKTYTKPNPLLHRINSSAGECGNSGLARI